MGSPSIITRILVTGMAVAALLAIATGALAAPQRADAGVTQVRQVESALLAKINVLRRSHGLKPVRLSKGLGNAAAKHAQAMAENGFFGHSSQDGTSPSARIRRFYPGSVVGETILWRSPGITGDQAFQTWLDSSPHRSVMLHPAFREIGLAAVHVTAAPGTYGGRDVTIVVADFGAP